MGIQILCEDKSGMKISIVTVSYNAADTIERTIRSVLDQQYNDLEYIIIDGGSNDGTVEIIKKYEDMLAFWVSEPDDGMYDALAKGFRHATGDIYAYINADDFYQPYSFSTVNEIFSNSKKVYWLTGIASAYNYKGQIVKTSLPRRFKAEFIKKGLYNGRYFPFVQQESTFWHKKLMQYVDLEILSTKRLAGDFYLWYSFADHAQLDIVSCILSGFCRHCGQLSENIKKYYEEMYEICNYTPTFIDLINIYMEKIRWRIPGKLLPNEGIIEYDFDKYEWRV